LKAENNRNDVGDIADGRKPENADRFHRMNTR
jgi:hypothetical protein